ncbi:TPA: D-hexose-6-phosphate mutarotase [Vibrio parahaemolyticus]
MVSKELSNLQQIHDSIYLCTVNGLDSVYIANQHVNACISLFGGQLLWFKPKNQQDVIWLGNQAVWDKSRPIRGGIPICFPWFGKSGGEQTHGFARNVNWELSECTEIAGEIRVTLTLRDGTPTTSIWPHKFENQLIYTITEELKIDLVTKNTDDYTWLYSGAIHTYFNIGDINGVTVSGVGKSYLDGVDGYMQKAGQDEISIEQETIRICLDSEDTIAIFDKKFNRTIHVTNQGHNAAVIWNPWVETTKLTDDMVDDEYKSMLCVESTIYGDNPVQLEPGKYHKLSTIISIS